MKTKRILTIAAIFIALAAIAIVAVLKTTPAVQAQDQLPAVQRISFGMVGITAGQTVRVSVANTILPSDPNLPPGPTRVAMVFRGMNGNLIRNRSGEVIRRVADLERGDSTFLDVDYGELPPGPIRLQLRAVLTVIPPPVPEGNALPVDPCIPTVEVINNANGRSQMVMFMDPGVIRGFNPQPDPPLGE